MLTIRCQPIGKKHQTSFRIVLIEKKAPPAAGKFLELLGSYNPHLKKGNFNQKRIKYWLSQGVEVSDRVWNLLIKENIIKGKKRPKKIRPKKKEKPKEEPVEKEEIKESKEESKEPSETSIDKPEKKE